MGKIILPGDRENETTPSATSQIILTGFSDEKETEPMPAPGAASTLYIDSRRFRMLPEELREYNCAHCDRRNAGWAFLPTDKGPDPDPIPVCSLCWLYALGWARTRQPEIASFVERYEKVKNLTLRKDSGGQLVDHREADLALLQLFKGSVMKDQLDARAAQKVIRGR